MNYLKCPKCNKQLTKINNSYKCDEGHSYDISKKGYVNMMLANQGHSLESGDKKDMVIARSNFLDSDKYKILRDSLIKVIDDISNDNDTFCDIACGEGYYTNEIHRIISAKKHFSTCGIDISKPAINHASSRKNISKLENINYFVGNMDYLPFLDHSFNITLNCFAPINAQEFNRVTKENGYYIRVLPGEYHLYELKEFLYPEVHLNIPKIEDVEGFSFIKEISVKDIIHLNNEEILNLFTMTPYYYKTSMESKERLKNLDSLSTQIQFVIRIYKK